MKLALLAFCIVEVLGEKDELMACCYSNSSTGLSNCNDLFIFPNMKVMKYQEVKVFYLLANMGCYCKMVVFSPFKLEISYYHPFKGNK